MKYEIRYIKADNLKIEETRDKTPKIIGYPAIFNKLSEDLGGFRERISQFAFRKALKKSDTRALWDHESKYVMGRESAQTLKLKEDDNGLRMELEPPGTQWAKDLSISIKRKDIREMSFAFFLGVNGSKWEDVKDELPIRTILPDGIEELRDVSVVTFPAYPDTEVALRSLEAWQKAKDETGLDINIEQLNTFMETIKNGTGMTREDISTMANQLITIMRHIKDLSEQSPDENGLIGKISKDKENNKNENSNLEIDKKAIDELITYWNQ